MKNPFKITGICEQCRRNYATSEITTKSEKVKLCQLCANAWWTAYFDKKEAAKAFIEACCEAIA